jgi:hypothetical protein
MKQQPDTFTSMRRKLFPMGMRLRLSDTLLLASRSLWIATLLFALILVAGRLMPIPYVRIGAVIPLALWALAVLLYLVLRPLPLQRIAQRIDTTLDLRERVATALELHNTHREDEISTIQQQDAAEVVQKLKPGQLPLRLDRRLLLVALLPMAVGMALLVLPNPQDAVIAERREVQETIDEVVEDLEQLEEEIAEDETLTPEEREELQREIAELQEELRENQGNREEALADLSAAEARLQEELDPQTDARRAALEQMARNLDDLSGESDGQQQPGLEEAAQQLEELAQELENLSEEERQELADRLSEQAAQMASGDSQTAQDLSDAAQSLRDGDLQQATDQLEQAASDVREAQGDIADQEATQGALSEIQDSREQVAQSGQQQEQQPGEGQQAQQGQQSEQSDGQQGGGQEGQQGEQSDGQQGGGQEGQQGQQGQEGQQPGGGGTDADNLGAGQSDASADVNPDSAAGDGGRSQGDQSGNTVYQPFDPSGERGEREVIEGQQGEGGEVQSQQGDANLPGLNNPSVVPYEQVLPEYSQSASEALDRGYIPPHLKNYVRDYFSQLEPGSNEN